jgi:hypothetical protein
VPYAADYLKCFVNSRISKSLTYFVIGCSLSNPANASTADYTHFGISPLLMPVAGINSVPNCLSQKLCQVIRNINEKPCSVDSVMNLSVG